LTRHDEPASDPSGLQSTIIATAIRFRGILVALSFLLLGYGALSITQSKYDVFPEFAPPQVGIQTEAPGLTPEDIEILVTQPLENAISGVSGIQSLRSASIQGLSVVTVTFDPGSDVYRDRQVVAERLAYAAQQLPTGIKPPVITPLTSSSSTVLVAGLTSKTHDLMELRTVADWTVKLRLLAVPGVSKVAVFGGDVRSIQVQVHPDQLISHGLSFDDVIATAHKATAVRGAGFIDTPNQRIVFRSEGQALTPQAVGRTVITGAGAARVTLSDVATVTDASEPRIGAATIMGRTGVAFVVSAQFDANTVEVTRRVEEALESLRPGLTSQGMDLDATLFRPARFIAVATKSVRDALLLGGIFVIVVLFLFLFDIRTAAISSIAIPLSLLAAVIVLNGFGMTLNTMTLGGLAIAIGEVVDDAVIDVENIVRRLRENRHAAWPKPAARVVLDASLEVRSAVVYATFTVLLVFIPVLTLPGIAGRFFYPLGLAYILALLASLIVALTVTPALCMMLLAGRSGDAVTSERPPPLIRWIRGPYERLLSVIARRPTAIVLSTVLVTLGGVALLPFFGSTFLPEFKEGHYTLHMTALPGTSIDETERLGLQVTKTLLALPAVRSVSQRVGRAESADDTWGPNYSEIEVDLRAGLSGAELVRADADIRAAIADFPGLVFSLKPFLTERVEETVSGYSAAVAVNIYGNDLDELDRVAKDVTAVMTHVRGAREVQVRTPSATPQLTIKLRDNDLIRWGLDRVEVLDLVRAAYGGDVVGQVYEGHRAFNVMVLLDSESRNNIEKVGALPIRTTGGAYISLQQVADINQTTGRYEVDHLGAQRLQIVTADVADGDVTSYVAAARQAIAAKVALPKGVFLEFAGSAQAQASSRRDLTIHSLIAFAGVILILSVITKHWRNLLLVLFNVPFALVGGILAIYLSGAILTLGSMVGFVALFGISLRNSIMMISHYEHLVTVEGMPWGLDTAIKGAGDRLTPILMTSLVTALGLLPLAVGMSEPGREIQGPMALVILGGLATSMSLNLLVLPTLALSLGRFSTRG
jgi:CzcA family heavy metal efflux pump